MTGMAEAMVDLPASLLGHMRGGLNYVLLGAMLLMSGISGAKTADMAAVAPVMLGDMKNRGNQVGQLTSLLAASGAMAETNSPVAGADHHRLGGWHLDQRAIHGRHLARRDRDASGPAGDAC